MKNLVKTGALLVVSLMALTSCKQSAADKVDEKQVALAATRDDAQKKVPEMTFAETEFDFGRITRGEAQEHTFEFTNTGKAPLIITDTRTSCGCTTPKVPTEPIAPGEKSEIVVRFNGSGSGQVSKTVTIMDNTADGSHKLTIKAFIETESN